MGVEWDFRGLRRRLLFRLFVGGDLLLLWFGLGWCRLLRRLVSFLFIPFLAWEGFVD